MQMCSWSGSEPAGMSPTSSGSFLEGVEQAAGLWGQPLGGGGAGVRGLSTHPEEKQPSFPEQGPLEITSSKHFKSQGETEAQHGRVPAPCHPAVHSSPSSHCLAGGPCPPFLIYKMGLIIYKAVRRFKS